LRCVSSNAPFSIILTLLPSAYGNSVSEWQQ
jgi:hypothetical protein